MPGNGDAVVLVSFGLWFVVVFGVRIAVWGNPLHGMVANAESTFLAGVDAVITGQRDNATEEELRFIRRFTQLVLLQLGVLLLEFVLLVHLWWLGVFRGLAVGLLVKDVAAIALGFWMAQRCQGNGLFGLVFSMPRWLLSAERVSAGISAFGALVFFLVVNSLVAG
ncbi:MAG: hypothetical protein JXR77_17865 [Lentisphaeria bacterium]|nr:hypothetical protein [Lentisphaeria bacterium]